MAGEYQPTKEDLIEAYASFDDGLDFKRAYFARREAARKLIEEIRAEDANQLRRNPISGTATTEQDGRLTDELAEQEILHSTAGSTWEDCEGEIWELDEHGELVLHYDEHRLAEASSWSIEDILRLSGPLKRSAVAPLGTYTLKPVVVSQEQVWKAARELWRHDRSEYDYDWEPNQAQYFQTAVEMFRGAGFRIEGDDGVEGLIVALVEQTTGEQS